MGRLQGAVAARAEEVFAAFTASERQAARSLLLQLVTLGEDRHESRRRTRLSTLDDGERAMAHELAARRLLVFSQDHAGAATVELSHEALLWHWDRLRRWIDGDREFLLWRARLAPLLAQWRGNPAVQDHLLRGSLLAEAELWIASPDEAATTSGSADAGNHRARRASVSPTSDEIWFVTASVRERRRRRFRSILTVGSTATLILSLAGTAIWLGVLANHGTDSAHCAALLAAAQSVEDDPTLAALLLREIGPKYRPPAWAELARRVAPSLKSDFISGHREQVASIAFDGTGAQVVTGALDGTIRVWQTARPHASIMLPKNRRDAWHVAFSRDGRTVASAARDGTVLVCPADGRGDCAELSANSSDVRGLEFSPDGGRLLVAAGDGLRIFDTRGASAPVVLPYSTGQVVAARFSADGARVLISLSRSAEIWSAEAGKSTILAEVEKPFKRDPLFSANGKAVAVVKESMIEVYDTGASAPPMLLEEVGGKIDLVGFSTDGNKLLFIVGDHLKTWNFRGRLKPTERWLHASDSVTAGLSASGNRLLVYGGHAHFVLDLDTNRDPVVLGQDNDTAFALSSNGARAVSGDVFGNVRFWNIESPAEPVTFRSTGEVTAGSFDATGTQVAIGTAGGVIQVSKADGTGPVVRIERGGAGVTALVFNSRGTKLVAGYGDGSVRLWGTDGSPQEELGPASYTNPTEVRRIALSPDDQEIAAVYEKGATRVWNARVRGDPEEIPAVDRVGWAEFSPDGQTLALAESSAARLWDTQSHQSKLLGGHKHPIYLATFSPNGRRILTVSADLMVVWNSHGDVESRIQGVFTSAFFRPNGEEILASALLGEAQGRRDIHAVELWSVDGSKKQVLLKNESPNDDRSYRVRKTGKHVSIFSFQYLSLIDVDRWTGGEISLKSAAHILDMSPTGEAIALGEGDTGQVWTVDEQVLFWRQTESCLSAEARRTRIGESAADAQRHEAACQDTARTCARSGFDACARAVRERYP
jgi:WD40 repeat protein